MTDTTHYASDTNDEGVYIPKSYQFERDMDQDPIDSRFDTLIFDDEANTHFVYPSMDELINNLPALKDMLDTFLSEQKPRLEILDGYSKGNNYSVLNGRRRLEKEKSDYRIRHNWGGYISNFLTGYVLGQDVTITGGDVDSINAVNWANDIDTLNYELGFDASRYGRAFELHYRGEDKEDHIVLIEPTEMFAIRDLTVNKELIGAVHCPIFNDLVYPVLYTAKEIITFEPTAVAAMSFSIKSRKQHYYGDVPVVEWWNNRFRTGDFETELSLIDAYDAAQSDTSNYMSDLNDALLVINGDFRSAGLTLADAVTMKQANMLMLESGMDHTGKQTSLSAEYIYKQYDVTGVEAYKDRLMNDIYKLSHVPNLDDDTFGSNTSGQALKYKLVGLDQIRTSKVSFYTRALRRRYELIENIHKELNGPKLDASELIFTFHPNIPEDVWAEVTQFIANGGELSQETLRELASFTDNDKESQRLAEENIRPNATDDEKAFLLGSDNDAV